MRYVFEVPISMMALPYQTWMQDRPFDHDGWSIKGGLE